MTCIRRVLISFGLTWLLFLSLEGSADVQDSPTGHMTAKRFGIGGLLLGEIQALSSEECPNRAGHPAIRYSYDESRGTLKKIEKGALECWQSETIAPKDWNGFRPLLIIEYSYDDYGRKTVEAVQKAGSASEATSLTQFGYDDRGRVECKAVRMNPNSFNSLPASACTSGVKGIHGYDRIARYTYDNRDQVLTEIRAKDTNYSQIYVTNTYEGRRLKTQMDANGNVTEYQYDDSKRLIYRIYPSKTVPGETNWSDKVEFAYDANGNLVWEKKRNGAIIEYAYDALNRMYRKFGTGVARSTWYTYTLQGMSKNSTFDSYSGEGIRNQYDGFGNLKASTSTMGGANRTISYLYDLNNNRARITHPDQKYFQYSYDGLNRLSEIQESSSTVVWFNYHSNGMLDSIERNSAKNGALTNFGYDDSQRLTSFSQNLAGSVDDITNTFTYTPANQIASIHYSSDLYHYFGNENRTGIYRSNGLNQYTSVNAVSLDYDANANLAGDGTNSFFLYDNENRLVSVYGAQNASFKYDPLGRLHEATVNGVIRQFLYDGDALIAEYPTSASTVPTVRYVHGNQVDQPLVQYQGGNVGSSFRQFLHVDHQGSIIAGTNSNGNALFTNSYDIYGIPAFGNEGRFGYTGQIWFDGLGLYHYKARFYHPKLGRFLQTDPVGYEDQMNLYAYVGNDPVNYVDPTGKYSVTYGGTSAPSMQAIQDACGGSSECMRQVSKDMLVAGAAVATIAIPDASDIVVAGIAGRAAMAGRATNAVSDVRSLSSSQQRAIRGLENQVASHQKKLDSFKANPDAHDNKGFLKNASPEAREKIIQSRIQNLEKQIETFKKDIDAIKDGTKEVLEKR